MLEKDRYYLVFLILALQGAGMLIPWNVFINAKSYFMDIKLNTPTSSTSDYRINFMFYLTLASQIPNLIMIALNTFYQNQKKIPDFLRCTLVMIIQIPVLLSSILLTYCDTSNIPQTFFSIIMLSAALINASVGLYQNVVFGMASIFPNKYLNAVIIGNNFSGVLIALFNIFAKMLAPKKYKVTNVIYLSFTIACLICCYLTLLLLRTLPFYRANKRRNALAEAGISGGLGYWKTFKQYWKYYLNIFLIFLCTLTIFPALQSSVVANEKSFYINKTWFPDITCFLFFNLFTLFGNLTALFIHFPRAKYIGIPVFLRLIIFIPLFLGSNYICKERYFPLLITNDHLYIFISILFAFTGGYLISTVMFHLKQNAQVEYAKKASLLANLFLVFGIIAGITASTLLKRLLIKY